MINIETLLRQIEIGEDQDYEFKLAEREFPKDIWETVSSFANTDGGYIVLGVQEKRGKFEIVGISDPPHLQNQFWNNHNNRQKINLNVCSNSDIAVKRLGEHSILIIHVPRARREQRPVYINNNPMTETYKRNHEGDYNCTETEVRQMLRDASNDPQDFQLLENYGLDDLDPETLRTFRQRFTNRDPDHQWLALDDQGLLQQLGGWKKDRVSGKEGLTVAGLLMFGKGLSISEAFPYHHLDYQEVLSNDPETRWTYRLSPDGKWEPNLFNFYYQVYGRLVKDLDVPFQLDQDAVRKGETHVHEALREALVNTLIHADHLSSKPIKITKRSDFYGFSNPGRLRISLDALYEGGVSDPRNPKLQKMFQMLALGEKAGSGFGKILRAWHEQQWFSPLVSENLDLELTHVYLPMMSFIPSTIEADLKGIVGEGYGQLDELDRLILVLSHKVGEVSNLDIQHYRPEQHPRDIGDRLRYLVEQGWLLQKGRCRGTRYYLPSEAPIAPPKSPSTESCDPSSDAYDPSTESCDPSSDAYDPSTHLGTDLQQLCEKISNQKRSNVDEIRNVILRLCSKNYLTKQEFGQILNKNPDYLRKLYLAPLVSEGLLQYKYPNKPTDENQAYKAVKSTQQLQLPLDLSSKPK
ncbi:MAG: RNA-binding domain-containing protein [Cyanobacteriota bacterium]|jgi:ATP-dependent DNA helicase RecG